MILHSQVCVYTVNGELRHQLRIPVLDDARVVCCSSANMYHAASFIFSVSVISVQSILTGLCFALSPACVGGQMDDSSFSSDSSTDSASLVTGCPEILVVDERGCLFRAHVPVSRSTAQHALTVAPLIPSAAGASQAASDDTYCVAASVLTSQSGSQFAARSSQEVSTSVASESAEMRRRRGAPKQAPAASTSETDRLPAGSVSVSVLSIRLFSQCESCLQQCSVRVCALFVRLASCDGCRSRFLRTHWTPCGRRTGCSAPWQRECARFVLAHASARAIFGVYWCNFH